MGKISASIMIEIMGKPPENVSEALRTIVTRMGSENGTKVLNKVYHEPRPVEGSKTLFTAFAEIELEFEALANYFMVIFTYMPSHVEITRPEHLDLTNADLNELSNALVQRLHNYEAVTKNTVMEKDFLIKKLKEIAPHLFKDYNPIKPLPKQKEEKKKTEKTTPKKAKKKKSR